MGPIASLGDLISGALAFLGPVGLLAAIFLIFLADAALFPALPEVFVVAFYFELVLRFAWAPGAAAGLLLTLAVAGDLCGNAGLYAVVRFLETRDRVPARLQRIMRRWTSFLAVSDERVILVNRIAPAVPLTGAFIAVCGWDLRKSLGYVALGGVLKYAALLALAALLGIAFDPEAARLVTIVAVIALVAVSFVVGHRRARTRGAGG